MCWPFLYYQDEHNKVIEIKIVEQVTSIDS